MKQSKFLLAVFLTVCFISCKSKEEEYYDSKRIELDFKRTELNYLQQLYSIRTDIEFNQKIKVLDSLIQKAKGSIDSRIKTP